MKISLHILRQCLRFAGKAVHALAQGVVRGAWILVIAIILAAGGLVWLDSEQGHHWLAAQVSRLDSVKLTGIDGSLLRNPVLIGLVYQDSNYRIEADRISLDWQVLPLVHGTWEIDKLQAGVITVTIKPTPPDRPPSPAPADLTLPFALHIQSASVAGLIIKNPDFSLQQLQFGFLSDGRHHQLTGLQTRRASLQLTAGLTLDGRAPFATSGQFLLDDTTAPRPFSVTGKIAGTLRQLELTARGTGAAAEAKADLLIDSFAPYSYQILRSGTLALTGMDPSRWSPSWPHAQLDLALALQGATSTEARGHLQLRNRLAGPLDTGHMPLETLESDLLLHGNTLQLDAIHAQLSGAGGVRGAGKLDTGRIQLDLQLAELDLARLWQTQRKTRLAGSLQLRGPWQAPDIKTELTDRAHAAHLIADIGWINPQKERRLAIRRIELQHGHSHLAAHGEFGLQSPYPFRVDGRFSGLNPAEFATTPAGSLTGTLAASGRITPTPEITLDYVLQNSRFNGAALSGAGKVRLNHQRLGESRLWLALGSNRMDLHGSYGLSGDQLQAELNFSNLHELGPQFSGQANGQFTLSGTPAQPALKGSATANQLALPSGITIRQGKLDVALLHDPNAPLRFVFEADDARQGKAQLEHIRLDANGSQAQHDIHLQANGNVASNKISLDASLLGSLLANWHWQGVLAKLEAKTPEPLRLVEPMNLNLAVNEVRTDRGVFTLGQGRILLGQNIWQPEKMATNGQLQGLALADILHWSGRDDFGSDLIFDGRWNLQYAGTLNGDASFTRQAGNSIWRLRGVHESLALTETGATFTARNNRVDMTAILRSSRFGTVEFSGDAIVDPPNFALAQGSGITLHSQGELPDLAALNGLASPDLQLGGNARFQLQRSGSLDNPHLSGSVSGTGLRVRDPVTGLDLRDGILRASIADDRLTLEEAFFRGGQGDVRAEGIMNYRSGETEANARIVAHRLTLFSRSDLLLVLSGEGEVSLKQGVIGVRGQIKADQGEIQYRDADTPRLANDVVITGRQTNTAQRQPRLTLQVDIDLGKDFHFSGYGVDAQLGGLLRLRAQTSRPLTANGKVEVVEGKYRAYGQRLTIERGVLSFQGPVDNPALDILAMRRNQLVEAGVLVSGNALNPRVQLYSEPAVPDTEKLAWLLFGHGSEGMQGADAAIMLNAAQSLLGNDGHGKGIAEEALGKAGIDELGMRSVRETDGTPTRIVTVSSQLGKYFRLSLEKSVNGLRDAVSLAFQVGRNWSLVTRFSNSETTAGVNYTIYFD